MTSVEKESVNAYKQAIIQLVDLSDEYLAQHQPFDLVLLDRRMPRMNGIPAAKLIMKMNRRQKIVFVSANAPSTIKRALPFIPRFRRITKPVELEKLLKTIGAGGVKMIQ